MPTKIWGAVNVADNSNIGNHTGELNRRDRQIVNNMVIYNCVCVCVFVKLQMLILFNENGEKCANHVGGEALSYFTHFATVRQ